MVMRALSIALSIALIWRVVSATGHSLVDNNPRSANRSELFTPAGLALGTSPQLNTTTFTHFTLDCNTPFSTIDYGIEVAGYPYFTVSSIDGPVQVEVKYSEAFEALQAPFSDGPFTFVTGLSNSFRVETFNFSYPGTVISSLVQGGQRWQSLRLVSGKSITFSQVGLEASISTIPVDQLPGQFHSSNDTLNEIWSLGARAATAACMEAGSQRQIWEVDSTSGVYARSVRPALSGNGSLLANYTLDFDTKIARGGSWWSVAANSLGSGYTLLLVGNLPVESTFANHNYTLFPANSILLAYGYDFVNQTTLTSYILDVFPLSFEVQENAWHHITTQTSSSGYLSTSINGSQVFNVSRSAYPVATASFTGTFGFGAYQDQEAYFRNVIVTDTANGSTLYENDMRSDNVLAEYGTQSNIASVCLDGAKRDRLVWMGDFYHTSRIIPVSTSRTDLSVGTLQFLLDTQLPDGELSISPGMGYDPFQAYHSFYPSGVAGLQDYQILGLLAFANHVSATNDVAWASETWPSWQRQVNWLLSKINSTDGLIYLNSAFLGDKAGGSALSCAAVQALTKVADVASAINDTSSMKTYLQAAEALKQSVNNRLWNESMGIYSLSPEYPTDNSVTSTAFCITSGVASANQTSKLLQSLEQLRLGPGYKDYSQYNNSDPTVNISPNTNGFLLDALFMANASEQAASLLVDLWSTMLPGTEEKDKFASGASWEYVNAATSQPGLSLFTSLSHPWGGAATYVLTERVAGLRAADGTSGFGYRNWVIDPQMGLRMGLTSASARVETAFGGALSVQWTVNRNAIHVKILAPSSTTGVFTLGGTTRSLSGKSAYEFGISI